MADPVRRLHYPFAVDAAAGRLAEVQDYDAYVRQLIRQVLLTAQGERINRIRSPHASDIAMPRDASRTRSPKTGPEARPQRTSPPEGREDESVSAGSSYVARTPYQLTWRRTPTPV